MRVVWFCLRGAAAAAGSGYSRLGLARASVAGQAGPRLAGPAGWLRRLGQADHARARERARREERRAGWRGRLAGPADAGWAKGRGARLGSYSLLGLCSKEGKRGGLLGRAKA